jgi:RING-like zinc finger
VDRDGEGIKTAAIFISRESGEALVELASYRGIDIIITANDDAKDRSTWMMYAAKRLLHWGIFVNLLVIALLIVQKLDLVILPFSMDPPRPEPHTYGRPPARMCRNLVKAMPCVMYNPAAEPNRTDSSCVICLEDFTRGEKLRLLPCYHSTFIPFC